MKTPPPGLAGVSPALLHSSHPDGETPASPGKKHWRSRDYMPHFEGDRVQQFITYHLADSLPVAALSRMAAELEELPDDERKIVKRERLQGFLDAGIGSCALSDARCARIVQNAFLHGDGQRYQLIAWVVMPNHVHALIEPCDGWTLDRIVHSWKSFTAHEIAKLAGGTPASPGGHLWHREYWDRYIRDERHYRDTVAYIENNPIRAGLCQNFADWPWGHGGLTGRIGVTSVQFPGDLCL